MKHLQTPTAWDNMIRQSNPQILDAKEKHRKFYVGDFFQELAKTKKSREEKKALIQQNLDYWTKNYENPEIDLILGMIEPENILGVFSKLFEAYKVDVRVPEYPYVMLNHMHFMEIFTKCSLIQGESNPAKYKRWIPKDINEIKLKKLTTLLEYIDQTSKWRSRRRNSFLKKRDTYS